MTGRVRWQCDRLSNGFSVKASRHQSQQTWNEPYALCCHGKWLLIPYSDHNIDLEFQEIIVKCDILFVCSSQQSQNVDTSLLKFPEQLKHVEAASR